MALRDNQRVMLGNRKAIPERKGQLVLSHDALRWQLTECAAFAPASVGRGHASEVGVISVTLCGVAGVTERLKVMLFVTPAQISR